jgi:hypothetical protein
VRGALAILAIALVVLSAACESAAGRAFSAQFPPIEFDAFGEVHKGPLPVELRDLTGTVVAIAADERRPEDDFAGSDAGVVPLVGRPNALRASWLGGVCSKSIRMQLSAVGTEYVLAIRDRWDPPFFGGACPAAGVSRVVVISFDRPVDPQDVDVRTDLED